MENTDTIANRGNWPSASQWAANRICPGRHLAQIGCAESNDPDAESGSAIHAAYAGKPYRELTPSEKETADEWDRRSLAILDRWQTRPMGEVQVLMEHRLWHSWQGEGGTDLKFSGQADRIYLAPPRALILDAKVGRNKVEIEARNLQLRILAVLLACNTKEAITEITVALVQHWAPESKPCVYTIQDLGLAMQEAEADVEAWYAKDAPRIPGPTQCRYCKAKAKCPEFAASGLPPAIRCKDGHEIFQAIARMSSHDLGYFLSICDLALDTAKDEARCRLSDGGTVDGWTLGKPRETRTIKDTTKLHTRFLERGGTTEQFLECISVGLGKFENAVKSVSGKKGKQLDSEVDLMIDGITETKTGKRPLERE